MGNKIKNNEELGKILYTNMKYIKNLFKEIMADKLIGEYKHINEENDKYDGHDRNGDENNSKIIQINDIKFKS